jgi:hypothetical protein
MEDILVPLYLHHRYQIEAASKVVGGLHYTYALRGDGQVPMTRVPAAAQERALDALMRTLDPVELKVPTAVLEMIPPRPPGMSGGNELFAKWTGSAFDAVSPAAAAADATLTFLLNEDRVTRLVEQPMLDDDLPSFQDVLDRMWRELFEYDAPDAYAAEINRTVRALYAGHLMRLAGSAGMPQVRATAHTELERIAERLEDRFEGDDEGRAMDRYLAAEIERFVERPMEPQAWPGSPNMPPGSPIGMPGMTWLEADAMGVWEVQSQDLSCRWR